MCNHKKSCDLSLAYLCIRDYLKRNYDRPLDEKELRIALGRNFHIPKERLFEIIAIMVSLDYIKISGKIGWRVAYVVN